MRKLFGLVVFYLIVLDGVFAHPGRTNAQGCHNDRIHGGYHCHNSNKSSSVKPSNSPVELSPLKGEINSSSPVVSKSVNRCETKTGQHIFTDRPCSNGVRQIATSTGNPEGVVSNTYGDKSLEKVIRLDYEGFTIWLDCSKRGAIKFQYNAQRDTGDFERSSKFYLDPNTSKECQQYQADSYKAAGQRYDRGHLVPANHLDYSSVAIRASNTMTNILPQAANMNRGAWLVTEEIIECYRDIDELLVIGGVIWGDDSSDDYFVLTHGIKTPDAFWKVIIRGSGQDERVIAWIVPNSQDAKRGNLDHYLVTVDEIERVTGEQIPVADYAKYDKPKNSWVIPRGCNKG